MSKNSLCKKDWSILFDLLQMMDTVKDEEELVFLYQLIKGRTSSSYACQVAAAMGLPPQVVARGVEVTDLISRSQPIPRMDSASIDKQNKAYANHHYVHNGRTVKPWFVELEIVLSFQSVL